MENMYFDLDRQGAGGRGAILKGELQLPPCCGAEILIVGKF